MMQSFEVQRDVAPKNEPLEKIQFDETPAKCVCPHCDKKIVTNVELQTGWMTIVLSFGSFLLFGWLAFCVLPFLFPLFQECCHYCPLCLNLVAKRQRIRLPKISNEVMTIKCGNCAIVLSRKYVFFFGVMIILITLANFCRWYLTRFGLPEIPQGPYIDKTWSDFLSDCGFRSYLGNPIHASTAFTATYYRSTVRWSGRVNKIQEGFFSKNFLFIRMEPSQFPMSISESSPDLALMFGSTLNDKIAATELEDQVEFEATMLELGKRGRPHLGMLFDLNVTAKHDTLPPLHEPRSFFSRSAGANGGNPLGIFDIAREMSRLQPRVHIIRIAQIVPIEGEEGSNGGEGELGGGEERRIQVRHFDNGEADDVGMGEFGNEMPMLMKMFLHNMAGMADEGDNDDMFSEDDQMGGYQQIMPRRPLVTEEDKEQENKEQEKKEQENKEQENSKQAVSGGEQQQVDKSDPSVDSVPMAAAE